MKFKQAVAKATFYCIVIQCLRSRHHGLTILSNFNGKLKMIKLQTENEPGTTFYEMCSVANRKIKNLIETSRLLCQIYYGSSDENPEFPFQNFNFSRIRFVLYHSPYCVNNMHDKIFLRVKFLLDSNTHVQAINLSVN